MMWREKTNDPNWKPWFDAPQRRVIGGRERNRRTSKLLSMRLARLWSMLLALSFCSGDAIAGEAVTELRSTEPNPQVSGSRTDLGSHGQQSGGRRIYFGTDVVPILTKLGCDGGGCHGKATGQNGFKLSLFGFEPEVDYEALVQDARGRRLFPADPDRSLLLLKALSKVPHGGGRRLDESSEDYQILRDWIAQGSRPPQRDDPRLHHIEVSPLELVMPVKSTQALKVTAHFTDGSTRDVTRQAVYQSNEVNIASVDAHGIVKTESQHGLVAIMARFGEQLTTVHIAVPFVTDPAQVLTVRQELEQLEGSLTRNEINKHLVRQWQRLGIVPSPVADDAEFIRRASIDICGTLPTAAEVTAFLGDSSPGKAEKLVDRLLERPEYASYFALKWADILQNRGAGYSTSQQRAGTKLFSEWIRDSFATNKPYDQFVSEILTASGRQNENPPAMWYRTVRKSPEYVESVAQAFLGVRIQCAQCHHHPTERWSQGDYFGLAAAFSRVGRKGGFADAEVPTDETIYLKDFGEVRHPRTGEVLPPQPLGGPPFPQSVDFDPRVRLAAWMTSESNPFFARTMVNRMWAHFLGRGLVNPIDDSRSTNPPSNPELLDALASQFIKSGYDIKELIRVITRSYAYRLDSTPRPGNAGDVQTFARFYPRRLTAEVLLDGLSQVLDIPTDFPGVPARTRAIELPDENVAAHFLDVFGRPARLTACECERVDAPALTQALELVNSAEIQRKLTAKTGYAQQLAARKDSDSDLVVEVFLCVLSRPPTSDELKIAKEFLAQEKNRDEAFQSLLWSLIATNEFLFNH